MTSLAKATPEWRGQAWPQFYEKWRERAKVTASFIKPNSRVLDLGCGSGLLRDYLPEGCTWHGYDIEPLSPDIRYIDLDAGEFPQGEYDYICLFVLAWLRDPKPCLRASKRAAPFALANDKRRRWSLRFPIPSSELKPFIRGTGWSIAEERIWRREGLRYALVCLLN